jgi:hypothetical protein
MFSKGNQPHSASDLICDSALIQGDVGWHWKTFVSDAVNRYVAEEADLENEVAEAVDNYETQVSAMIASLSGTMLAAVGVLIGSFIAAAFKDKFNTSVFVLGIVAYMVYLALFPGLYNMIHHSIRFRTINEIFEKRKERFSRLLGIDETSRIVGSQVSRAKSRFRIWFSVTIVALVAVLVLAGFAAYYVPPIFAVSPASPP